MRVDYYAYQIVGCRIDSAKLTTEEVARQCKCKVEGEPKFCPACGKKFMVETGVPIPAYDVAGETVAGLSIAVSTNAETMVLGLCRSSVGGYHTGDAVRLDLTWIREVRETVRAALEPLGLWDEAEFGVWTLLHCSY